MSGFDYSLWQLNKKMRKEAEAQKRAYFNAKWNESNPVSTAANRAKARPKRGPRPATVAKQEQRLLYGRYDPTKGLCPKCNMILAKNGACTGGCE